MANTPTRADTLTETLKRRVIYSDFMTSFAANPVNGELARVTNERDVIQSVENLILTDRGERLFQPIVGSNVLRAMFNPVGALTMSKIKDYIIATIRTHEPRVNVIDVVVAGRADGDWDADEHALFATITFTLMNTTNPISTTILLKVAR